VHDLNFAGSNFVENIMVESNIPAAGNLDVMSPYDGALLASVPTGGKAHAKAALETAYALFRDRDRWLSIPQRIGILQRAAELMPEDAITHAALAHLLETETELLIALPQTRQYDYIKEDAKIEIGWNQQSGICFARRWDT